MSSLLKTWMRKRISRVLVEETGVAAVEFAMLAPMFIALLFVSILVGVVFMAKSELDYTTQRVARLVMTGQVTTSAQLKTAVCTYTGGLIDCNSIMANLSSYASLGSMVTSNPTLTYGSNGAVSNTFNANFGNAGSIMVLQLMYQYPMISGQLFNFGTQSNGTDLMVSTAVFVNE